MENNKLNYILLTEYAIENIDKINSIKDITARFSDSIEDITKEAHERIDEVNQIFLFHKYIAVSYTHLTLPTNREV